MFEKLNTPGDLQLQARSGADDWSGRCSTCSPTSSRPRSATRSSSSSAGTPTRRDSTSPTSRSRSSCSETEHHEIAVYETLVTNAEARGAPEVARLLRQNLEQEQAALEKVKAIGQRISTEGIAFPA